MDREWYLLGVAAFADRVQDLVLVVKNLLHGILRSCLILLLGSQHVHGVVLLHMALEASVTRERYMLVVYLVLQVLR